MASYQPPYAGGYQSGNSGSYQQPKVGGAGSYQPYRQSRAAEGAGYYPPPNADGYHSGNIGSYQQANVGGYLSGNTITLIRKLERARISQDIWVLTSRPAVTSPARRDPWPRRPLNGRGRAANPLSSRPAKRSKRSRAGTTYRLPPSCRPTIWRSPAVRPGQHLVIPRYRTPSLAYAPPTTRITTTMPAAPSPTPVARLRAMVLPNARGACGGTGRDAA